MGCPCAGRIRRRPRLSFYHPEVFDNCGGDHGDRVWLRTVPNCFIFNQVGNCGCWLIKAGLRLMVPSPAMSSLVVLSSYCLFGWCKPMNCQQCCVNQSSIKAALPLLLLGAGGLSGRASRPAGGGGARRRALGS